MLTVRQYEDSDYDVCRNRLWVQLAQRHQEIYNAPDIGGDDPGESFDTHLGAVGSERLRVAELDGKVVGRNTRMLEFVKKQGFDTLGTVELILRDSERWVDGAEVSGVRFKV